MDKDWILAFAFFMLFNNSPEVIKIISSKNFDKDYDRKVELITRDEKTGIDILMSKGVKYDCE